MTQSSPPHIDGLPRGVRQYTERRRDAARLWQLHQALHEDGAHWVLRAMRWLRGWERRVLSRVDWVHIPTRYGQEQLARDLGQYPFPATGA